MSSTFHKFKSLPPELRRCIWEAFYPDIKTRSKIIGPFSVDEKWQILPYKCLWDSQPMRTIALVDGESRSIVTQRFPDQVSIDMEIGEKTIKTILRYEKKRDVALIEHYSSAPPSNLSNMPVDFFNHFQQIAIHWAYHTPSKSTYPLIPVLPEIVSRLSLSRIYVCQMPDGMKRGELLWNVSSEAHHDVLSYYDEEDEDFAQTLYCWLEDDRLGKFGNTDISQMIEWDEIAREHEEETKDDEIYSFPRFRGEFMVL